MGLSRLRLRLTGSYAIGFFAVLVVFNLLAVWAVRRMEENLLTSRLTVLAHDLLVEVPTEYASRPRAGWDGAAARVLSEWPGGPDALIVYDAKGERLAVMGAPSFLGMAPARLPAPVQFSADTTLGGEHWVRRVVAHSPILTTVAIGSLDEARRSADALGLWLFRLIPILLLLSLALGYLFAGRALAPMNALAARIAGLDPDRLDLRLPVRAPPDEIDRLAAQFNESLARLQSSRLRNRRFVQQAAHQIRTPLTILLGEAALQRSGQPTSEELRDALDRIWTSAHQMQRRVDELVTLAAAEAGEAPAMDEAIELEALVFEATDLMRHRAAVLGHPLQLLGIEEVSVRGNEALLLEALLELLENACRHGEPGSPVGVRVEQGPGIARFTVVSRGAAVASPGTRIEEAPPDGRGLGLSIVRWIAERHGGHLEIRREEDQNLVGLALPVIA